MKYLKIAILLLVLGTTYFYSQKDNTENKIEEKTENRLNVKAVPSDYWESKWSYPSSVSQAENYKQSVKLAENAMIHALSSNNKSGLSSKWRLEGPTNIGGRANCLLVDSRDPNTIYAGMVAGGIFKTNNGGTTWFPITDDLAYLSISDIIQDPLLPNTIYAATGDRNFGSWGRIGDGVKVSHDSGKTWQSSGLNNVGVVSKLIIDSTNRVLWASVLGNPRTNSTQRGVFKSTDMGITWQQVHSVNSTAGAIDMVMDPINPQVLYVSYFNRQRTSVLNSAHGNDGRIWKTADGGVTWTKLTNGLPNYPVSRIGLAISQQNPNKIYATIVDSSYNHEGLYLSTNAGQSWVKQPAINLPPTYTGGFGWYFGQIRINPLDDNEVWLLGVELFTSQNSGITFTQTVPDWQTYEVHADKHDLVFYGQNQVLLATDGGLYKGIGVISNPNNWIDIDLIPNNQFYRIAINPHLSEVYAGGVQDNGTSEGAHTQPANWKRVFGGDGFQMIYDPVDPSIFYCETQYGNLYSFDTTNSSYNYNFDDGVSPNRNWDMPFIMSRFNKNKLYCLSDQIHVTNNGPVGIFSPVHTGILNNGTSTLSNSYGSALCESKVDPNLLYAGTGDGNVWRVAANSGIKTNITSGLPNRYVTALNTSATNTNLVVVSHSGYLDFQNTPHLHLSLDRGNNWNPITGDLPPFAINDVEILDNSNDSVLFVASDVGVYITFNRGVNWHRVGNNMPMIPVNDIEIDYSANRLVAGTHARSMMSFDLDSLVNPILVGSRELFLADQVIVYPNPANRFVNIETGVMNVTSLEVINSTGTIIQQQNITDKNVRVDVSQLIPGVYFVRLNGKNSKVVKKVLVRR
jgi:photosystem II stability/assembly factor-like uncharacterized protein